MDPANNLNFRGQKGHESDENISLEEEASDEKLRGHYQSNLTYHTLGLLCALLGSVFLFAYIIMFTLRNDIPPTFQWEARFSNFPRFANFTPKIIGNLTDLVPEVNDDYLITTSFFGNHMDIRWGDRSIIHDQKKINERLVETFQAWSRFCEKYNVLSWIAHGTLIGWSWNQKILPWDIDIDVQTTTHELLTHLVHLNQTEFEGRFFFDVNKHIPVRQPQTGNFIDARFIDKQSGLYVDITGLSFNEKTNKIQCKSPHYYNIYDIFPIHQVMYEGVRTWIPNNVGAVLVQEYHKNVKSTFFSGDHGKYWRFLPTKNEWHKTVRPKAVRKPVPKH